MIALSPRQRDLQEREKRILEAARRILLEKGYYGTTMDHIAREADCPKATVYQQFSCKEDIVLALAQKCVRGRTEMIRRGAAYEGSSRVGLVGIGEGVALFSRLNPDDSRIVHLTMGPLREKGSPHRVAAIERAELVAVDHVEGLIRRAIADGDLRLTGAATVEQITYGLLSLVEGAYMLMEGGMPQRSLGIGNPVQEMWWIYNRFADAYAWKPLLADLDWEEVLANIRKSIFPDEAQRLYGEGAWYGDHGSAHPALQAAVGGMD